MHHFPFMGDCLPSGPDPRCHPDLQVASGHDIQSLFCTLWFPLASSWPTGLMKPCSSIKTGFKCHLTKNTVFPSPWPSHTSSSSQEEFVSSPPSLFSSTELRACHFACVLHPVWSWALCCAHHSSFRGLASGYNFIYLFIFRVYGGSQARDAIGAAAEGLPHRHSNAGSQLRQQATSQLIAMPDP